MGKPRKWTIEDLVEWVPKSRNFSELARNLGLRPEGVQASIRKRIQELGLDTSHFENRSALARRTIVAYAKKRQPSLESVMIEGSTYSRCALKKRLLKMGLLKEKCFECGQEPNWRGKRLPLILDHINGINNDHRFKNLRLLCPNCSFTLDTYGPRNWKNLRARTI